MRPPPGLLVLHTKTYLHLAQLKEVAPGEESRYRAEAMPRGELLGSLELIVLLAVARLGSNAYGMTARQEIEKRTGRSVSIGAVYATLERLQTKGYVSSSIGEPTAERGGRAKRHFQIESDGERALAVSQDAIRRMATGLTRLRSA